MTVAEQGSGSCWLGLPCPHIKLADKRLNKVRALAAFSPDALSSIAYANQEIYLGPGHRRQRRTRAALCPIGLAITGLLTSWSPSPICRPVHGYPSGGGSYVVARENLGTICRAWSRRPRC